LHKLVYVIAGLGILHFFWMRAGKQDFAEVAVYAAIIAILLGWRLVQWVSRRWAAPRRLLPPRGAATTRSGERGG